MKRPLLTRKLLLEHAVRNPDGSGGYTLGWEALGTLWASVRARRGRERAGVAGPVSVGGFDITVRGAPVESPMRPVAGQRFRDGTRVFAIHAVAETDDAGMYLTCISEEEVAV
ncbi:MAG: head-tail adaptor protein [Paracoccaceae bacterium]